MDILTYINKMNRLYGSEQQVASLPYGTSGTYGAPESEPMPNMPDLIREEGIQVGQQVKDGGRIGFWKGGLLKFLYQGEKGLQHGAHLNKLRKLYKSQGMKGFEAYDKAMNEATNIVTQKKLKIVADKMNEVNVNSDDFVDLIDEHIRLTDYDTYKDIKRWDNTRPSLADKSRALRFPDWAEARYGEDYHAVLERGQTRELRESIDPNIKEPAHPSFVGEQQMVDEIDEMNKANLDELFEGRKKNAQGGRVYDTRKYFSRGQLVQPGPGRQGYQGEDQWPKKEGYVYDRKTKRFRKRILTSQTQLSPENLEKWNTFQKSKDFRKFIKDNEHLSKHVLMDKWSRTLSKKNKVIGVKGLVETLGVDNPYSFNTLRHSYTNSLKKITKNMSNQEKSVIRSSQKIWNIINETLGEPITEWAVQRPRPSYVPTGERAHKMWNINKSQIKKLNKALNKNKVRGVTPNTIKNVYKLLEDEDLMKALDAYKGGKIDESHPILKAILKGEQTGARIHAFTTLGEALRGDIELEGISKNLKRGNRIIKSLHGNYGGPLGAELLRWAKRRMGKHFDDPNATYTSLTKTIRTALDSADLNHLAVDEIFPARTGQISIGKGSGAYNQIVQFIDQNINMKEKKDFDARAGKRYKAIIAARNDKNWARVNKFVEAHQKDIDNFYEVNPQAKGKVKLTQLDYNPKTHTFASPTEIYGKDVIPSKIKKDMDKFYKKTGLSLDVGSTMTLEKAAAEINKDPIKLFKKMGYKCKLAGGAGESVACYMKDVEKTRADMKSSDVTVRAKALTKQRNALKIASKIPQLGKILKTGVQMGTAAITAPLKWLGLTSGIGYAIEGIVEGGFYDNARRKGYSHEQALAETLTPGLAAGRPEGVPWYGGAEELRKRELYEIKGRNEFIDVENRPPMQDPEFGKVIGTRGKVKQYIDALEEQDRIYDLIGKKEALKDQPTTTDETLFIPGDLAAASADVQDLARSGAYRRVDQTLKPESMAAQAYETAVEQQLGKDLQRKKEYLEKYDPGALEREEKILSRPRQLKKRYQQMEEKYPTYTREQLEQILKGWKINTPWDAGFASGVKGYDEMAEWLKMYDKLGDIGRAGGVANMADGGRIPFGKGKLVDEGRRAFMKWLAGITGATVAAGTGILKWGKVAGKGKTIVKAGDHIIQGTPGMPDWFIPLINRVTKEGTDVTKKLGTVEREIVHTKSISKTEDVTVYQNLDTGNVRVEYGSPEFDKTGKVIRASNDPDVVHLEYKAPVEDITAKGKPIKTESEFSAAEYEPEVVNWDGDIEWSGINEVNKVDDLVTDTSKLKEFGKNKKLTHRDKVIAKKKNKYQKKLQKDTMEQVDYIENKRGPFQDPPTDTMDEFGNVIDEFGQIIE